MACVISLTNQMFCNEKMKSISIKKNRNQPPPRKLERKKERKKLLLRYYLRFMMHAMFAYMPKIVKKIVLFFKLC